MQQDNVIEAKDVKKKFKIYPDKGMLLKEKVLFHSRNRYEEKWVLNGISFNIQKGEAVGLIGHNGCGKSTTLKLLTKIMYPDSGSIEIKGRVSSLLELGAGFHPDMTGRENIYINASIFGLGKKEIDQRLNDIIRFSELEEYIDNPVRTYSSGMYMRLAFSVAINVDADILLIDEILAVGDVNFQAKCFNKLMEIKRQGTTIVLVSHSMGQIEQLCTRSIWLQDGLIRMDGSARQVDNEYLIYMGLQRQERVEAELVEQNQEKQKNSNNNEICDTEPAKKENVSGVEAAAEEDENSKEAVPENEERLRAGTGQVRFSSVKSMNADGKETYAFRMGDNLRFQLNYKVNKEYSDAYFGLSIFRNDGVRCYGTNSKIDEEEPFELLKDGSVILSFPQVSLLPGHYYVDVCVATGMDDYADYWSGINEFEVFSEKKDIGVSYMEHIWQVDGRKQ